MTSTRTPTRRRVSVPAFAGATADPMIVTVATASANARMRCRLSMTFPSEPWDFAPHGRALIRRRDAALLQDWDAVIEAAEVTPVIDRTHSLTEVPDAIRYLEEGHTQGKVVLTL